jgi:NAD(P)-dependent dehydrogenase (short-subunit alcohol dehydrogenase family)
MKLKDRVAIVTGASSGIGRGIALEFAKESAKVVVADMQEAPKRGKYYDRDLTTPTVIAIQELGAEGLFVQTDVSREDDVRNLVDQTVARFGKLEIVVNNAGINVPGTSQTMAVADWDRVISVNLRALFLTSKFSIPHLKASQYGRIIHIASVHFRGGGSGPPYAASKAAVVNLARDTALEVGRDGITVNVICPGFIETPIQDYMTPAEIEAARQRTVMPRFGLPKDIGRAAVFLASQDAEWITGASLVVDGGYIAAI